MRAARVEVVGERADKDVVRCGVAAVAAEMVGVDVVKARVSRVKASIRKPMGSDRAPARRESLAARVVVAPSFAERRV